MYWLFLAFLGLASWFVIGRGIFYSSFAELFVDSIYYYCCFFILITCGWILLIAKLDMFIELLSAIHDILSLDEGSSDPRIPWRSMVTNTAVIGILLMAHFFSGDHIRAFIQ